MHDFHLARSRSDIVETSRRPMDFSTELAWTYSSRLEFVFNLMPEDFIIHGDLSAYNILLWEDESIIIDVPQVVDPMSNANARWIFDRDVKRVCEYFTKCGIETDCQTTAGDLWSRYVESGDSHSYFFGDPIAGVTSPSA